MQKKSILWIIEGGITHFQMSIKAVNEIIDVANKNLENLAAKEIRLKFH